MQLKGKLAIYKVVNGRLQPILKTNALTYAARNILADLLGSGSTNLQYMTPLSISSIYDGDRSFIPVAGDTIDFTDASIASIDLTAGTQEIDGKIITSTTTITYSPIDNTASTAQASLVYTVNLPAGVLETDAEFNCLAIFDSTSDPATDISLSRLFSFAVLPAPVVIGVMDNIVITYTYEIQ